ncbi:hypothetical protein V6N11_009465 [Hibiscus sabdariffa]|uniref:Vesicle transport protein GOT1 n=1 Tax=Hibiscus sabdariffa TaxID=183260 RepID=A0ABR2P5H7_9ROSI
MAGILEGITNIVPGGVGGVNIKSLLDDAAAEVGGKVLLDFKDKMSDKIQISWNSTSFDLISTAAANTKMVYEITEQQKVGLGLIGFGISFTFLGVTLFFDRGLLALGNILWLAGVVVLIGWYSTLQLFRKNYKGSIAFLLGLFFLFVRWPIVGIILEIYGCLGLFGGFWPSVSVFLCHIPVVGWFIQYPVSFLNRLGRGSN